MSNIAGLLSSLLPPPQPDASARAPSGQRDAATPGKGSASGFDAILSKMGQNDAAANPGGAAKSGMNLPGAAAATNTIIENAIASTDVQMPAGVALHAAASTSAFLQSSNTAAKTPAGTPGGANGLPASGAALPGTGTKSLAGGLASQLQATATANAQPAATDANSDSTPTLGVFAQLPAALARALSSQAASSDASASATSTDARKGTIKSAAANPANAVGDNIAANAAVITADMVVAGQPVVTPTSTDKANAGGKTSRGTNADAPGRTTSKQNASSANPDAPASGTTLDPSLQSAVLASVGLDGSAPQPSQPSLLVPSGAGQGSSDPDLKAIMTASAVATANSAAKLGTGAEDTGDDAGLTIVSVLSTETHFAPPAQLSPVQQIADTIVGALLPSPSQPFGASTASAADETGSTTAASATFAGSVADSGTSAIAGPVKILNLQLEPPSLGTVTINLSLSDGGLNVQLAASQASTMSIIDKDKDALSNQLRESGYSVAGVGVTISIDGSNVPNNGSATQDQMGQSAAQGGQTMANGGSSNGNGGSQSGNGSPQQPLPQTSDLPPPSSARSPAAGDLYI